MSAIGWVLVFLSAGLQVCGTLLLRSGVDRAGGFANRLADVPQGIVRLISEPVFVVGFILYGLAALVWFQVLSTQPLSLAYPLLVSLTFLFVTVGAMVLFKEPVTARKFAGLAVILIGIFLIGGA